MNDEKWQAASALLSDAYHSAMRSTEKYPQPNYVCAKLAEELGETIQAFIHTAEGRPGGHDLRAEVVQLIGLAVRLYIDGDKTISDNAPDLSEGM